MSDHDPLCPALVGPYGCDCDTIAATRADERERIAQAIEATRAEYYPRAVRLAFAAAARIARDGGRDV